MAPIPLSRETYRKTSPSYRPDSPPRSQLHPRPSLTWILMSLPWILTRENHTELGRAIPGPNVHITPIFWDRLSNMGVGAGSKRV